MLLSSGRAVVDVVGLSCADDGVQDVDASSGQGDDGLVVGFPLVSLAGVVGLARRVEAAERTECRPVEDPFESAFPGRGSSSPLANRARATGGGEQFGGEHCSHSRQAGDEGRVRKGVEQRMDARVNLPQPTRDRQGLLGR